MKKLITALLSVVMAASIFSSCYLLEEDVSDDLFVGMEKEAFMEIAEDQRGFIQCGEYCFFANVSKNYVVVIEDTTGVVKEIQAFDNVVPAHKDFLILRAGDDVCTVVKTVGLPKGSVASESTALRFEALSGVYTVYFDGDMKVLNILYEKKEDNGSETPIELISSYSMTVGVDCGRYIENQITTLVGGCKLFFDKEDYGIETLVAGDVIEVHYVGEFIMQETYPGTVMTQYFAITDIFLEEAFFIPVTVAEREGGGLCYVFEGYTATKFVSSYIISEDGAFRYPSETDIGEIFYASCKGSQKGKTEVQVEAVYDYLPRGEAIETVACWNCGEAECAYYETYDADLCEACYVSWQENQMQPCCFCGSYTCTGCIEE